METSSSQHLLGTGQSTKQNREGPTAARVVVWFVLGVSANETSSEDAFANCFADCFAKRTLELFYRSFLSCILKMNR